MEFIQMRRTNQKEEMGEGEGRRGAKVMAQEEQTGADGPIMFPSSSTLYE